MCRDDSGAASQGCFEDKKSLLKKRSLGSSSTYVFWIWLVMSKCVIFITSEIAHQHSPAFIMIIIDSFCTNSIYMSFTSLSSGSLSGQSIIVLCFFFGHRFVGIGTPLRVAINTATFNQVPAASTLARVSCIEIGILRTFSSWTEAGNGDLRVICTEAGL
jgi:hypothetical protein